MGDELFTSVLYGTCFESATFFFWKFSVTSPIIRSIGQSPILQLSFSPMNTEAIKQESDQKSGINWKMVGVSILAAMVAVGWAIVHTMMEQGSLPIHIETKAITAENHSALSGVTIRPGVEIPLEQDGKITITNGEVSGFTPTK